MEWETFSTIKNRAVSFQLTFSLNLNLKLSWFSILCVWDSPVFQLAQHGWIHERSMCLRQIKGSHELVEPHCVFRYFIWANSNHWLHPEMELFNQPASSYNTEDYSWMALVMKDLSSYQEHPEEVRVDRRPTAQRNLKFISIKPHHWTS